MSGIIISTLFVLIIVFISENSWLNYTEGYIKDKEEQFMITLSQSLSDQIESILSYSWYFLYIAGQTYLEANNGTMKASLTLNTPDVIILNSSEPIKNFRDPKYSAFYSANPNNVQVDFIANMKVPDAILRSIMSSTGFSSQIGYILLDQSGEYLYPIDAMNYVYDTYNYSDTCSTLDPTVYAPQCMTNYILLQNATLNNYLNIYYENSQLNILYNLSYGAAIAMLPLNYIQNKLPNITDYVLFGTEYLGKWTLFTSELSGKSLNSNYEIKEYLYKDNSSQNDFNNTIQPLITGKNGTIRADINGETIYFSISSLICEINAANETDYVVGVSKKETDILNSWTTFIGQVYVISIIQSCIFAIFIILSMVTAWRLALIIMHRVTVPIQSISGYLKSNDPPLHAMKKAFNKQSNSIIESLESIQIIESYIDPIFLLNPVIEIRLKNLKIARKLFKTIENKRGLSIIYNLIGNVEFSNNRHKQAKQYYCKALNSLETLLKEIELQETEESNLSDTEKLQLHTKRDDFKDSWADEKKFINDLICERKQQICLALFFKLKESAEPLGKMRNKWKKLIKYQTQIIQHYESSRENYIKYLKVLLDMSEVFQILQYYHTAQELLEIVAEELWKLDIDKKIEVDVDVNRLRKIGIDIFETEKNSHFMIQNITFEKDILMQHMLYRRGMIELDNDKYQKAATDFTLALVINK